jgi:hypothetical protein
VLNVSEQDSGQFSCQVEDTQKVLRHG